MRATREHPRRCEGSFSGARVNEPGPAALACPGFPFSTVHLCPKALPQRPPPVVASENECNRVPSTLQPATALPPTSLDPHEINPEDQINGPEALDQMASRLAIGFRHSGWAPLRKRVWTALRDLFPDSKRLERFESCGTNAWVYQDRDTPTEFKVVSDTCRDRWCLPCGQARARTIAANVTERMKRDRFRFITLTLRSTDKTLNQLLDQLSLSFQRFRQVNPWRKWTKGGVAFTEVKHHDGPDRWNVHLHVVAEGGYMKRHELMKVWHRITGDSYMVDIKLIRHASEVAQYVAKYASKPLDKSVTCDSSALKTAIEALHGRRLISTFGNWRGIDLTVRNDDRTWIPYAHLATVKRNAEDPHHFDAYVWRLICHEITRDEMPRPPPPEKTVHVQVPAPKSRTQSTFNDWLTRASCY